jgi:dTDP-L-rhamnose 4-epimerase
MKRSARCPSHTRVEPALLLTTSSSRSGSKGETTHKGINTDMRILITGGAGFIGSHVADELIQHGHRVRAYDNLSPQVHGAEQRRPAYLHEDVELIRGDVRDAAGMQRALTGVDAVYHFASAVGVGQSMYEIDHYVSTNNLGTAVLLQALSARPVERLIVASSMSIYGEGLYRGSDGTLVADAERSIEQLRAGDWEPRDAAGAPLEPVLTPESKRPCLSSVYALSKFDQERLCLMVGRAYGIPTVALRFFNVFGTRQALSNPYTGVLAIFASRLLNDNPPLVFEDGLQRRDFVSVYDVVQACRLALDAPGAPGLAFNVGSGTAYTIRDVAELVAAVLEKPIEPVINRKYRVGDIRHCVGDVTLASRVLGYRPAVTLESGLIELAEWLRDQAADDHVADANLELLSRGLTV